MSGLILCMFLFLIGTVCIGRSIFSWRKKSKIELRWTALGASLILYSIVTVATWPEAWFQGFCRHVSTWSPHEGEMVLTRILDTYPPTDRPDLYRLGPDFVLAGMPPSWIPGHGRSIRNVEPLVVFLINNDGYYLRMEYYRGHYPRFGMIYSTQTDPQEKIEQLNFRHYKKLNDEPAWWVFLE